jgi:hypothetical protein
LTLYSPWGDMKKKKIRQKKYFSNGPYNIGNQIRWVRKKIMTHRGE